MKVWHMSSDPLLQPCTIRRLRLKNRIMSTSHAISYVDDGLPRERYQLYHEAKARGGLALTMFGGSSNVSKDSPSIFSQIDVSSDRIIPHFEEFSQRIHQHGTALMCQITHLGRRGSAYVQDWLPPPAPSRVREFLHRAVPREMDQYDIDRIVRDFGDAASRCEKGGLDGLEILAGGHLVGQFLSPLTNMRTDDYGGSLLNRTRFARMVMAEMRRRVGSDFIIGLRLQMDENSADGLNFDDCVEIVKLLHAEGGLDFINGVFGRMDSTRALADDNMPGMHSVSAPFLSVAGKFRKEIDLPLFHAARITDLATARYAIQEGLLDMVGMTRGHIADPNIVSKLSRGEEDRIRPCTGASYCLTPQRTCIHNPSIGREATFNHHIEISESPGKKVVVVGGGPAGLEVARVSAARGHKVTLFEATGKLGGQIGLATFNEGRRELGAIAGWLEAEVGHLGVTIHYNRLADAADVLEESPDVVVVATGGLPAVEGFTGSDLCLSTWDVMDGGNMPKGDVLVYDETGTSAGTSTAEVMAQHGATVELISPDDKMGMDLPYIESVATRRSFQKLGIRVTVDHTISSVESHNNRKKVVLRSMVSDATSERVVDHVVVEKGTYPLDDVFHDLLNQSRNLGRLDLDAFVAGRPQNVDFNPSGSFLLYRIGDAVASRNIHAAILEGLRIGSGI